MLRPEWKVPRFRPVSVHFGEPMTFETTPNDREGWMAIAAQTEDRVREMSNREAIPQ